MTLWLGCTGALLVVLLALGAPVLAPLDPEAIDLAARGNGPGLGHWLGTDRLGRDVLSRLVWGARISVFVGFVAAGLATAIGLCVGTVAGMAPRAVDDLLSRLVDLALALPTFFLLVAVQSIFAQGAVSVAVVIGCTVWMALARLARAQILSLREREFVLAARSLGCGSARLMRVHLAPHLAGVALVFFALTVADALLIEAALSFLGLGVPPYAPSWGNMLIDGQTSVLNGHWWVALFPGAAVVLAALSVNAIGDALERRVARV
ncbi:MAG: ABC transporter permease [Chloroflexota bacterium]